MERGPIVSEYHQLRQYLNRANKLSNQKTELKFEIEQTSVIEYRLYAVLVGQFETHRLALAERTRSKTWERTGYTRFVNLEEFCALTLNRIENKRNPNTKSSIVPKELLIEWKQYLSKKLSNLLLNRGYEP